MIRRCDETAAARSQANTARLPAENPVLARMKELEVLQEILVGAKTTSVFGSGELVGQVRTLVDRTIRDEARDGVATNLAGRSCTTGTGGPRSSTCRTPTPSRRG